MRKLRSASQFDKWHDGIGTADLTLSGEPKWGAAALASRDDAVSSMMPCETLTRELLELLLRNNSSIDVRQKARFVGTSSHAWARYSTVVLNRVVEGFSRAADIAARACHRVNNASRHPAASPAFAILRRHPAKYRIEVARLLAKVQ